ncbi:50S ribosomal protein L4 [Haladaptatus sp. F3-133]|uniref:Large ribosomal subunit protein uL4 n=1 Tax=Halorutilus salinus TaxID=2487751 RepID=A0A9Q4C598_9EURY|nr:50S ribosomal protein L4 [Halorutilus salinus]MCX2818551.1 50S ribosomal protein L4 [Halorutilus salinus]
MKAQKVDTDGDETGEVTLPGAFGTPFRPDIVERAFLATQANEKQPYGADEFAGMRTSAESPGSGQGIAHVPRINNGNRAARVPHSVGGRKAHPPKAEKKIGEDFNDKERALAFDSAVAATADEVRVRDRGHDFDEDVDLPVVVDAGFEELVKTQEVVDVLETLGLHDDIQRADEGRGIRAGRGTTRGRKYRTPTSILFVTSDGLRAARNLPGADVVTADELGVADLAPGGDAGRLTVWTEPALEVLDER